VVKEQAFDFVLYGVTAEIFRGETLIKKINYFFFIKSR
jgi:hypothetical protein